MDDYLVRGVSDDGCLRAFAAVTTGLVEEARRRHGTWPVASAALGRALTAGLLLGANLKGDDLLTLRIFGDGPVGGIVVAAKAAGEVRGYIQEPRVDLPAMPEEKLPVGAAVGKGFLHITKDLGLKEPFTGSVELVSGEIGEDVAHYLLTSEQLPSAVALGVLVAPGGNVRASGGLIIQLFPGSGEDILYHLEKSLGEMPPVTSLVDRGMTPEEIMAGAVQGLNVRYLEKTPVCFKCNCSREKASGILAAMGWKETKELLEKQGRVEVCCHFCGNRYVFDSSELEFIIGIQ
jgi:molecular chaperone Hsp33